MSISKANALDARWVEVPRRALSTEALVGVVDEYVTREGTEYGEREYTLLEKRAQAMRMLERGDVIIAYELTSCTTTLKAKDRV